MTTDAKIEKRRKQRQKELEQIRSSPRAKGVYIVTRDHACPLCRNLQGTYGKHSDDLPELPIDGCSCIGGCDCRYEPLVVEVGP